MKKRFVSIITIVILIFAVVSPVAAFDGGGQLDTNITLGGRQWFTDNFSGLLGLTEKATGWFRTPLPFGTLSLEGGWTFNMNYGFVWPLTLLDAQVFSMRNTLDINLVKYNLPIKIKDFALDLNFGRFPLADITGMIFNQSIDGLYASIPFSVFTASAGIGYTGLLNAKTTSVYGIEVTPSASSVYAFAPGYVAVLANASAPSLIGGQSFDAEVNMFFNCNTVSASDHRSRSYISIGARGPVIPLLYYDAAFSFGFALGSENKIGVMGKAGISFFPDFLASTLSINTLFATKNFLPFTDLPLSTDGRIGCSDVLKLGAAASMKPTDKWLISAEFALLYASEEGTASFGLNVLQANLDAKIQMYSDLCIVVSNGLVIPVNSTSVNYYTGSVRAQLSF